MWPWMIAGAGLAALVAAAVLVRRWLWPGPWMLADTRSFLLRFQAALAAHPGVEYRGMLPGRFACLLRVDGQDTAVGLHELYRRADAFPGSLTAGVAMLVREIEELGLDRIADHDFATVATSILPQVRSRAWIEANGRFGDAALVHRDLTADLAVVYVVDDPQAMVFVCRAHLRLWRRSAADLHHLAVGNLQRRGGLQFCVAQADREPVLVQSGDGYDAARVLLLDAVDGLLVAMPDRDLLWIASERDQDLPRLAAAAATMAQAAPHPVSDRIYRLKGGCLEPLADG
jgi:uncharacterized protein YtpQ (UPF0354 family)